MRRGKRKLSNEERIALYMKNSEPLEEGACHVFFPTLSFEEFGIEYRDLLRRILDAKLDWQTYNKSVIVPDTELDKLQLQMLDILEIATFLTTEWTNRTEYFGEV
jgi:hypothetical protein